ncbi:MAG: SCO family protein [Chitinophagaceae bacterium]
MYRIVYSMFISFLLFSCKPEPRADLPYYNTPDFTPQFLSSGEAVNKSVSHQIADFSFTNQDGKLITQKTIEGKIHVADFIFTSCGSICPVMTDHLQKLSNAFNNDSNLVLLSFTVTPWIDSVARLKKYVTAKNIINPNWHFLTGKQSSIYHLARTSYFAEEDIGFTKDSTEFLHTEHILLVDKNKRIRGIYNGTLALEVEQLIKDIEVLKKE